MWKLFAFMDPGITATFCTGDLQKKLNVKGKPTQILLNTMGQNKPGEQKLTNSYVISDLEVCGLEDNKYIQFSQRQSFGEEIKALQRGKQVSCNSRLFKLDPILQDVTLRVGRRLNKSAMPENVKHPAILSKHSRVATLILRGIHQRTRHCGQSYVLAQLRCKY